MFMVRWLPTFLAFPIGGLLAIQTLGSLEGPLTAAAGGVLAGAVIGFGQWLALRSRGIGPAWVLLTALGMAAGLTAAVIVSGAATTNGALVITGLIAGAVAGGAQARLLDSIGHRAAWTIVASISWGAGWLVTGNVIVDAERGYYSFGASGALLVTVATGLVLPRLLGDRRGRNTSATVPAAPIVVSPR